MFDDRWIEFLERHNISFSHSQSHEEVVKFYLDVRTYLLLVGNLIRY